MYFEVINIHLNDENGNPFKTEGKPVGILNETIYLSGEQR